MSRAIVAGAGLSGLIAASMLREEVSAVFEVQSAVPNNHAALLRFRSGIVGDATGIPFSPVKVMKAIHEPKNPVRDAIDYSVKVTGRPSVRSILSARGEVEERWIAPDDFINRLAFQSYGKLAFDAGVSFATEGNNAPIISTVPMPSLMKALEYPNPPTFESRDGWVVTAELEGVDVCATLYYPRNFVGYRASVTRGRLIVEGVSKTPVASIHSDGWAVRDATEIARVAAEDFGLGAFLKPGTEELKKQRYAKILPIAEDERRRFLMWATDRFNVYSLGRFATWRPGLMLDDLVNDVRTIQKMIRGNSGHAYNTRKSQIGA